jgi:phosphoglycerate dehydrogenase-like enzyme
MTNEMILRAKLRRMQAEAVMDRAARRALIEEAEKLEALSEKYEAAPDADPVSPQPVSNPHGAVRR